MKYRILKHIKKNSVYSCSEVKKVGYKCIYFNRMLNFKYRYTAYRDTQNFIKGVGKPGLKNFCLLSGRSRGVFSEFSLSRIEMRNLFSNGKFLGVSKGCW